MSDKFCLTHKEKRRDAFRAASVTDCPYCEIERLKEENKRLNDYIKQTSPRVDVDLCYTQNARYRMALKTIATETIEPAYSTQIATRWRMIAKEAVGEVQGERFI